MPTSWPLQAAAQQAVQTRTTKAAQSARLGQEGYVAVASPAAHMLSPRAYRVSTEISLAIRTRKLEQSHRLTTLYVVCSHTSTEFEHTLIDSLGNPLQPREQSCYILLWSVRRFNVSVRMSVCQACLSAYKVDRAAMSASLRRFRSLAALKVPGHASQPAPMFTNPPGSKSLIQFAGGDSQHECKQLCFALWPERTRSGRHPDARRAPPRSPSSIS